MMNDEICNDPTCKRVRKGEIHKKHDLAETIKKQSDAFLDLIKHGSKFGGPLIGAGVGFLLGNPIGIVIGTGMGSVIESIGNEVGKRLLARREKERIGYTILLTINKIKENLEKGQKLRTDDFFNDNVGERSTAKEITEGMLIAAQREHQEKKLPYFANLLANLAFSPEVNKSDANLLIKLAEDLTYRQLCALSLFEQKSKFSFKDTNYRETGISDIAKISLFQEIFELYSKGMVNSGDIALLGINDVKLGTMNTQGTGYLLYTLMELAKIELHNIEELVKIVNAD